MVISSGNNAHSYLIADEICLHSYSLHSCYHYMTKVEHPLEECIGMFHHGSNTDIPADTLQRQCMSPYRSIHCAVYTPAFGSEISLVPVTYDSRNAQIGGGTSLCILQEDVPLWSCNGHDGDGFWKSSLIL